MLVLERGKDLKYVGIFILLITLTFGLLFLMDVLQGVKNELALTYLLEKTELVPSDYVLLFFFTVPFAIPKLVTFYNKKIKKNQDQTDDRNTASN